MGIFNKVKRNNTAHKNFEYSQGKCTLKFILRTDIKQELKDFLEILKIAEKEVEEELKKNA